MNNFEIAWAGKHFGEEPPISGANGSGTIFFCRCNLKCVFCQNWQISHENISCETVSGVELLQIIFKLQEQGCENINLVSPTSWALGLKEVLSEAKKQGLKIPVVWNSNGYEDVRVVRDVGDIGVVDVFLPDYKYSDNALAIKYSSAPNYPKIAKKAIMEMYSLVGDFVENKGNGEDRGNKGLIVRHLIIPGLIENTINCLKFIRSISPKIHLSLMTQYNPLFKAKNFPEINRTLMKEEYEEVMKVVEDLEFENGWIQEFGEVAECMVPDFTKRNPFGDLQGVSLRSCKETPCGKKQ